jgi:hypothetical protein
MGAGNIRRPHSSAASRGPSQEEAVAGQPSTTTPDSCPDADATRTSEPEAPRQAAASTSAWLVAGLAVPQLRRTERPWLHNSRVHPADNMPGIRHAPDKNQESDKLRRNLQLHGVGSRVICPGEWFADLRGDKLVRRGAVSLTCRNPQRPKAPPPTRMAMPRPIRTMGNRMCSHRSRTSAIGGRVATNLASITRAATSTRNTMQ